MEFHVDDCKKLQDIANQKYKFGGDTSYFIPESEKPVIIFGQDEVIFQQYLLTKKTVGRSQWSKSFVSQN